MIGRLCRWPLSPLPQWNPGFLYPLLKCTLDSVCGLHAPDAGLRMLRLVRRGPNGALPNAALLPCLQCQSILPCHTVYTKVGGTLPTQCTPQSPNALCPATPSAPQS